MSDKSVTDHASGVQTLPALSDDAEAARALAERMETLEAMEEWVENLEPVRTDDHDKVEELRNTLTPEVLAARGVSDTTLEYLQSSRQDFDHLRFIGHSLLQDGCTPILVAAVFCSWAQYPACKYFESLTKAKRFPAICKCVNAARKDLHDIVLRDKATAQGMPVWVGGTHDEAGLHPLSNIKNVQVALETMGIGVRLDLFRNRVILDYKGKKHLLGESAASLTDGAEQLIIKTMDDQWGFDPGDVMMHRTLLMIARQNRFDPVLDYLDECQQKWESDKKTVFFSGKETPDQKDRMYEERDRTGKKPSVLDRLPEIFNVDNTPLNRAILKTMMIGAVRRARVPGCKFDPTCVLESPEGFSKSKAVQILAGKDFFSDQHILGKADREAQELVQGVWLFECADLSGMRKADVNAVKSFASRQEDRARPAYGRNKEYQLRRCVMWGTTNDDRYLQSQTGNRRFWPLRVNARIDTATLIEWRDAIWGEAAHLESRAYDDLSGEPIDINIPESMWDAATEAQEERRTIDPWEDLLRNLPDTITARDEYEQNESGDTRLKKIRVVHRCDASEDSDEANLIWEYKGKPMRHADYATGEVDGQGQPIEKDWPQMLKVSSPVLLTYVLNIPFERQTSTHWNRLGTVMGKLGWHRTKGGKEYIDGDSVNGYRILEDELKWRRSEAAIDASIDYGDGDEYEWQQHEPDPGFKPSRPWRLEVERHLAAPGILEPRS